MRENLVNILNKMLAHNVGQQLTPELATGIATTFSQAAIELETQAKQGSSEAVTRSPVEVLPAN